MRSPGRLFLLLWLVYMYPIACYNETAFLTTPPNTAIASIDRPLELVIVTANLTPKLIVILIMLGLSAADFLLICLFHCLTLTSS